MIDPSRLSALESYRPDDDTPDSANVSIPAGDLRDLVALIPVVRAAMYWRGWTGPAPRPTAPEYPANVLERALDDLRAKGDG